MKIVTSKEYDQLLDSILEVRNNQHNLINMAMNELTKGFIEILDFIEIDYDKIFEKYKYTKACDLPRIIKEKFYRKYNVVDVERGLSCLGYASSLAVGEIMDRYTSIDPINLLGANSWCQPAIKPTKKKTSKKKTTTKKTTKKKGTK